MAKIYLFKEVHKVVSGDIESIPTRKWCGYNDDFESSPDKHILTFEIENSCCTERIRNKLRKKFEEFKPVIIVVNMNNMEMTFTGKVIEDSFSYPTCKYKIESTEKPKMKQLIDWDNVRGEA